MEDSTADTQKVPRKNKKYKLFVVGFVSLLFLVIFDFAVLQRINGGRYSIKTLINSVALYTINVMVKANLVKPSSTQGLTKTFKGNSYSIPEFVSYTKSEKGYEYKVIGFATSSVEEINATNANRKIYKVKVTTTSGQVIDVMIDSLWTQVFWNRETLINRSIINSDTQNCSLCFSEGSWKYIKPQDTLNIYFDSDVMPDKAIIDKTQLSSEILIAAADRIHAFGYIEK